MLTTHSAEMHYCLIINWVIMTTSRPTNTSQQADNFAGAWGLCNIIVYLANCVLYPRQNRSGIGMSPDPLLESEGVAPRDYSRSYIILLVVVI